MITAKGCRMNSLALTCEYCEKYIEPQLITKTGPIYHGMYDSSGTKKCYISKTYAANPPRIEYLGPPSVSPKDIKEFLEALGYTVEWVKVNEPYEAGTSASGRTHYYNPGFLTYWSLKISY